MCGLWPDNFFQGLTAPIVWILLSQLANPSTSKKRRTDVIPTPDVLNGKDFDLDERKETKVSLFEDVLPGMLTKNGVLTRILINGVLVRGKGWRCDT